MAPEHQESSHLRVPCTTGRITGATVQYRYVSLLLLGVKASEINSRRCKMRARELAAACLDFIALEGGAGVALSHVFAALEPRGDRPLRAQAWLLLRRQRALRFFRSPKGEKVQASRKRPRPAERAGEAGERLRPSVGGVKSDQQQLEEQQEELEERWRIPDAVVETLPFDGLATRGDKAAEAQGDAAAADLDDVVVVASDELRYRALNVPVRAIVTELGADHFRILEAVGRARVAGVTTTDLACMGQAHAVKKLHNTLDTLISYGLVVKRMLIVSRPLMRRLNIIHLPRFAGAFSPTMFDEAAEFESDENTKRLLLSAAEVYLKSLPNNSSVLTDLGRDLKLGKRHCELLRAHIVQESKRDENFPLELFQAVLHPSKRRGEPKILNCVRYKSKLEGDALSQASSSARGISVEMGLLNQIFRLIEESGDHGATIVELRNRIVLPGSKLPYKLVSVLAGTYGLRAETIILGKNKAFRLYVNSSARVDTPKSSEDVAADPESAIQTEACATDDSTSDQVDNDGSVQSEDKTDGAFVVRANKALKVALGGPEIDITLERRRNHILERLDREKIISLSSLRASVFGMERIMASRCTGDQGSPNQSVIMNHFRSAAMLAVGVVDTRSILRIANDLETEKKLRLLQLPLPARNVSTKFRALRCVVLPGYEENERFIKDFVKNYCRDERIRRIRQNAERNQVVQADSVGSDDEDVGGEAGIVASDPSGSGITSPGSAAPAEETEGPAIEISPSKQMTSRYLSLDEVIENSVAVDVNSLDNGKNQEHVPTEISYRIRRFISQKKSGAHNHQYRKLGFAYGVMYRCRILHQFIWSYLHQTTNSTSRECEKTATSSPLLGQNEIDAGVPIPLSDLASKHPGSPRPSKGVIFSREEVLHAMPIYLYIQVFSGGEILSPSEFAQVQEGVEKKWLFDVLPIPLREKIWSHESSRTAKVLGTLADLNLVVPYKIGMANLKNILQAGYTDDRDGVLSQALKDNALGGLFRLNNNVRIILNEVDAESQAFASAVKPTNNGLIKHSINELGSLKLVGVTEKTYSFSDNLPLHFELNAANDVGRYWEALECLCLEQMVMEVPNRSPNGPVVSEVPKPASTRARRMLRILAWIPKSQKDPSKMGEKVTQKRESGVSKSSGIVSTTRRARKRKLSMMSNDQEGDCFGQDGSEQHERQIKMRKKKAENKIQAREVGARGSRTWTAHEEQLLVDLFIESSKSRWSVTIPQALQSNKEEVAFRTHMTTRLGFGLVALARKLNKRTIDVKKRLKERLTEPMVKLWLEQAKEDAMNDHNRVSRVFDEEIAVLRSARMTALFRIAVLIILSPQEEYHPLVAEELIAHWSSTEIRTVWRYMWLKNWIVRATEKERGRGYAMSQHLSDSLKVTTLSYPMILFRQAAEQASVVTSALVEAEFEHCDDNGQVVSTQVAQSASEYVFEAEFPRNASPGRCALELMCQVTGKSIITAYHTPFLKAAKDEDDDDEDNPDDVENVEFDPQGAKPQRGKESEQLLSSKAFKSGIGFAAHLAKRITSKKVAVFLENWRVETRMQGVAVDKDAMQEFEAFGFESNCLDDESENVANRPFKKRKTTQETIESAVVRLVKAYGEEGITFPALKVQLQTELTASVNADESTPELPTTSAFEIGRCLDTLVASGEVLCVNAYFEQRYLSKDFGDPWLLRPFSLMPSTGTKAMPRVLFEGEKDTMAYPWLKMDGSTNHRFLLAIQRKLLMFILQFPGISEERVFAKMGRLLSLQDTREALSLLVDEGLVYTRSTTSVHRQPLLFGSPLSYKTLRVVNLPGSVLAQDRSAVVVHYFPHVECVHRFGTIVQDFGEAPKPSSCPTEPPLEVSEMQEDPQP